MSSPSLQTLNATVWGWSQLPVVKVSGVRSLAPPHGPLICMLPALAVSKWMTVRPRGRVLSRTWYSPWPPSGRLCALGDTAKPSPWSSAIRSLSEIIADTTATLLPLTRWRTLKGLSSASLSAPALTVTSLGRVALL